MSPQTTLSQPAWLATALLWIDCGSAMKTTPLTIALIAMLASNAFARR
jgi:hypothetical protein